MAADSNSDVRVIVVVRDGKVTGVCASNPALSVDVLDYDDITSANMPAEMQALSDEADSLVAVY